MSKINYIEFQAWCLALCGLINVRCLLSLFSFYKWATYRLNDIKCHIQACQNLSLLPCLSFYWALNQVIKHLNLRTLSGKFWLTDILGIKCIKFVKFSHKFKCFILKRVIYIFIIFFICYSSLWPSWFLFLSGCFGLLPLSVLVRGSTLSHPVPWACFLISAFSSYLRLELLAVWWCSISPSGWPWLTSWLSSCSIGVLKTSPYTQFLPLFPRLPETQSDCDSPCPKSPLQSLL